MPEIWKRDFSDAAVCGRCIRGESPLRIGIAYFFRERGGARYAGPKCAQRDATNWGQFPDFTRAYAATAAGRERALHTANALQRVVSCQRFETDDEAAVVLEYLGLRVKLGASFDCFPCLPELTELQLKVDRGEALERHELHRVLQIAANYAEINPHATSSVLQACYALDRAFERLVAAAGDHPFLVSIRRALRSRGSLTTKQLEAVNGWLSRRGLPMPRVDSITRVN